MAVTVTYYNQFLGNVGGGAINLIDDTFKAMLVNGYIFNAAHDQLDDVQSYEITAQHGYEEGGKTLTNNTFGWISADSHNKFDADDVSWQAEGGTIGPTTGAIIYSETSTGNKLVCYIDFGASQQADNGDSFKLTVNTGGLFVIE